MRHDITEFAARAKGVRARSRLRRGRAPAASRGAGHRTEPPKDYAWSDTELAAATGSSAGPPGGRARRFIKAVALTAIGPTVLRTGPGAGSGGRWPQPPCCPRGREIQAGLARCRRPSESRSAFRSVAHAHPCSGPDARALPACRSPGRGRTVGAQSRQGADHACRRDRRTGGLRGSELEPGQRTGNGRVAGARHETGLSPRVALRPHRVALGDDPEGFLAPLRAELGVRGDDRRCRPSPASDTSSRRSAAATALRHVYQRQLPDLDPRALRTGSWGSRSARSTSRRSPLSNAWSSPPLRWSP